MPHVINSVQENDYNTNISESQNKITTDDDHDKYSTTQEFEKLKLGNFAAKLVKATLANKTGIANIVKKDRFK